MRTALSLSIGSALWLSFAAAPPGSAATVVVSKNGPLQTVQAGIDAAFAGDTVVIKAGTYFGNATIGSAKTGLTLKGSGKVVLDARGPGGAELGPGITVAATGVTIRGLTIRNAAALGGVPGDGIRIDAVACVVSDCIVTGCEDDGVEARSADCEILDCAFVSNNRGVRGQSSDRLRIVGCTFRGNDNSIDLDDSDDVLIQEASIKDSGVGDVMRSATSNRLTVRKVKLSDAGQIGDFSGDDLLIEDVVGRRIGGGVRISGNTAIVRDLDLVDLHDACAGVDLRAPNSTISNVRCVDASTHAIFVDELATHCQIDDVVAIRSGTIDDPPFLVEGDDASLTDCSIVRCPTDGFSIIAARVHLTRCVARQCAFDGFDVPNDANEAVLEDCVATQCLGEGIEISSLDVSLIRCIAKQNRIDFANDGVLLLADVDFVTGGATFQPEID
jgi:hypothetical protein